MANSKCQLPTGSFRVQKKAWTRMKCGSLAHFFIVLRGRRILECCAQGYEEVHVKPFKHPDVNPEDLIPLSDAWRLWRLLLCEAVMSFKTLMPFFAPIPRSKLPTWCQEAFPGATKLNTVQSKAQQHLLDGQTLLDCTRPI